MISKVVEYKINRAMTKDLADHLKACNDSFYPPLDQRVDINTYVQKIHDHADTFEAWCENRLVGLVAAYCNGTEKNAYITNVSILDGFSNRGIASRLLEMCIEHAESLDFSEVALRVNMLGHKARRLYKKYEFQEVEIKDGFVLMRRMK